uniref:APC membrane recruitment protein 3 n=1 Tax=Lepisosteus oculatus TaxID=7918 RepID=W5NLK9_LEPOC|nr:PREDICTED: APC membrane recruitment protein 3 [Lepisosteus oculatus]XP_015217072.1 PREDICTED: APC membrane recruitment protein 3 [Lepisosteus oculatus]
MELRKNLRRSSLPVPEGHINTIVDIQLGEDDHGLLCTPLPSSAASSRSGQDAFSADPPEGCSQDWVQGRSVKKSKTHDCVAGVGLQETQEAGSTEGGLTLSAQGRGRLVSSVSFSGFGISAEGSRELQENRSTSSCGRQIIDYRNFVPQVPFVPSIAKSIPKKRISLRKPRKAFRDLFGMKRNKHEKANSPGALPHESSRAEVNSKGSRRHQKHKECSSGCSASQEYPNSDPPSDSSNECCSNLCEDVASLKSFDSQTGCGEIFADDEQNVPLEMEQRRDPDKDICEPRKPSPVGGSFQGGIEQLASPAQTEVMDFLGQWGSMGNAFLLHQNRRIEGRKPNPMKSTPTKSASEKPNVSSPASLPTPSEQEQVDMNADMATPKSDNQESISTSDEGYYDSLSPGQEDNSKGSLTPCSSTRFPRDSYSGDALYELFYDPNESGMTPIFDDNMSVTESILGLSSELPLSMHSFHVGAEENLAPPLALDIISQELLQSNWKGKECLLKLCDTEISLAMGIVNWLRQKAEKFSPSETVCSGSEVRGSDGSLNVKAISPDTQKVPEKQDWTDNCDSRRNSAKERPICLQNYTPISGVVPPMLNKDKTSALSECNITKGHGESKSETPTNSRCFKCFSEDQSYFLNKETKIASSPGSGTNAIILLAIKKESLCESCKISLKHSSKDLHLCASCLSFIEQVKTTEVLNCATDGFHKSISLDIRGTCPSLPLGFFEPPSSPSRKGDEVNLMNLLEKCVGQMSALTISGCQDKELQENEPFFLQFVECISSKEMKDSSSEKDNEQNHRFLKPKKSLGACNAKKGKSLDSPCYHHSIKNGENDTATMPQDDCSVQEAPFPWDAGELEIGLVTTNSSDELVLETYRSPCSEKSRSIFHSEMSAGQPHRPTYLPISKNAYSEISNGQQHRTGQFGEDSAKGQVEKSRRHRRSVANVDGPHGYVLLEEKKEEQNRRM